MEEKKKPAETECEWGIFDHMNQAIEAAEIAQKEFVQLSLGQRGKLIEAIRKAAKENAEKFARMAVDETGMGKYEDKIVKIYLQPKKLQALKTCGQKFFLAMMV